MDERIARLRKIAADNMAAMRKTTGSVEIPALPRKATKPQRTNEKKLPCKAGHELSALLSRFGINYSPGCKCRSMSAKMDALGCDWCESDVGMAEIVATMRQEAEKRGLPFLDAAARLLVRRAIKKARKSLDQP